MERALRKEDWLRAARLALLKKGASEVRIERLAHDLRVTKGSFYWHFKNREELLEILLREWEEEFPQIVARVKGRGVRDAVRPLLRYVVEQAPLSEKGLVPSDAAIFTWASVSAEVARRVNRTEEKRLKLLKRIVGSSSRAEILYLVWLGFVARGKRLPETRKRFPQIARSMLQVFPPEKSASGRHAVRRF